MLARIGRATTHECRTGGGTCIPFGVSWAEASGDVSITVLEEGRWFQLALAASIDAGSACVQATSSATNAVSSSHTTAAPSTTTSNTSSTAVIAGVVGGFVAISLLAILIFFLVRRRNRRRTSAAALANTKETAATSDQSSSNIPTPVEISSDSSMPLQELETPPPDPWHSPRGDRYELSSPDLASEEQGVQGSRGSKGVYRPYRPADKERPARHKLYDEGRNVSYELDGRAIDYHRES